MSEKYVVTWDMFQMHARKLSERLLPASQWKGIIAVSRGGLFPAAVLARELSIRHVETVCIASYHDHNNQGELQVLHAAQVPNGGEGFIIVDDLVDTGNTARAIREMYPNAKFVTEATACGLQALKGHKVLGGMRASIYNAMPIEGVDALIAFMDKFAKENA